MKWYIPNSRSWSYCGNHPVEFLKVITRKCYNKKKLTRSFSFTNWMPRWHTIKPWTPEHGTPAEKRNTKEQQNSEHWRNSRTPWNWNSGTPAEEWNEGTIQNEEQLQCFLKKFKSDFNTCNSFYSFFKYVFLLYTEESWIWHFKYGNPIILFIRHFHVTFYQCHGQVHNHHVFSSTRSCIRMKIRSTVFLVFAITITLLIDAARKNSAYLLG